MESMPLAVGQALLDFVVATGAVLRSVSDVDRHTTGSTSEVGEAGLGVQTVDAGLVEAAHAAGIRVHPWTVDDPRAIVALAAGIMNVMPWGGPTVRAAAAMSGLGYEVTGSELWVGIMPAWIAGLVTCLLVAAFLGKKEAKRIAAGIPAQEVTGLTEAKTTNTSNELARSGWRWYFNVALILVILYILVTNRLSPAVTFMIGYCVLLIVNYPSVDLQHKIINSHAQAAFLMVSIVFAAGAFTGVVKNSGMLASMTDALVSIIPTSMGTFIAPIVGLFSVPLSLLFDPDSYYYGVMPVIANAVSAMGGNALAVAKASIMGQMTLGFPLSPLTGATFLLLGLSGQDLGDHQKHTLPYAWVASAIMVAVGCVACGLLF